MSSFDVVHISRLVFAAEFAKLVEEANEANPEKVVLVPESEYQVRAIPRKLTDEQKLEVWRQACARSENQPTNQVVNDVRLSLFPTTKESKPPTKKNLIVKALKDVETLLDAQAPFEDIKSSLHHLSRILKVDIDEDEESSEPAEAC